MPNANTIERLQGGTGQGVYVIPSIVPTTTSAFVALNQPGTAAALSVGTTQYLSGASTAPSFGVNFDGFPFKLRIAGKVTTGASCNLTVAFQVGSSTTVGTAIATTGAKAVNTTSANFCLEAMIVWDSVAQVIQGWQVGQVNNSLVSVAALSSAASITTQANLVFAPVLTFSATTGATLTITEFVAETV